ncbi:hypothetical protein ACFYOD_09340 [Streptomyces sp. NPDC006703]|uniref:hypothetical protein n=1 Tax=Streptomyces sp. NPDC006703 TaxID=3364759 RepID=UPI0036BAE1EC
MGLFNRKQNNDIPADPAAAELGREYAIAKRHGDRKTVRRITRELSNGTTNIDAFEAGQRAYDEIPPAYPTRRNRRR